MGDGQAGEVSFGRSDDWDSITRSVLGLFDQPAYVRRALRVEEAMDQLRQRAKRQRNEWLSEVRVALAHWDQTCKRQPSAGELLGEHRSSVDELMTSVGLPARPLPPPLWPMSGKRALRNLARAVDSFNRRWLRWIEHVDLGDVNRRVDEYNAHYLLEKECAFRSPMAAARGFVPLQHIDSSWLGRQFSPLPTLRG